MLPAKDGVKVEKKLPTMLKGYKIDIRGRLVHFPVDGFAEAILFFDLSTVCVIVKRAFIAAYGVLTAWGEVTGILQTPGNTSVKSTCRAAHPFYDSCLG